MKKIAQKIFLFGVAVLVLWNQPVLANGIKQVDSLNNLSYDIQNVDSSFNLAQQALDISKGLSYSEGEITAYLRLGRVLYIKGNLDSALGYINIADSVFTHKKIDSAFLAKILIYKGLIYKRLGRIKWAIDMYKLSYQIAKSKSDTALLVDCLINQSNLHKLTGNYEGALEALYSALDYLSKDDFKYLVSVNINMANILDLQERRTKAMSFYTKAYENSCAISDSFSISKCLLNIGNVLLKEGEYDRSKITYQKALQISEANEYYSIVSLIYQNYGELYRLWGKDDSSYAFFNKSLRLQQKLNSSQEQSKTYERIGDYFSIKNNFVLAISNYKNGFSYALAYQDFLRLSSLSGKLSNAYSHLEKKDSVIYYVNLSSQYRDSISARLNASLLFDLNYQEEKYKVQALEQQNKAQEQVIKRQKNLMWFALTAAGLIVLVLVLYLRFVKEKGRASELERKSIENQKKVDNILSNQEQITLGAVFENQEQERNRISGELHDKIGSLLSTVKMYFKSIDEQMDKLKVENKKKYVQANTLLDEACDEVRKISHELSTGALNQFGLFKALDKLKRQIEGAGELKVELNTFGSDKSLSAISEIAIYRCIQELTGNVLKHAKASEMSIQVNNLNGTLNVMVEDNGDGFDVNQIPNLDGIGLSGVEKRVKQMRGTMEIDSGKGAGTTITIDIPKE